MVDIICMKWGSKYDSKYVNRLYNQCVDYIKIPFNFHCITDDKEGIKSCIYIHDYNEYKTPIGHWGGKVNTSEKLRAITNPIFKNKILYLDLDLLILKDITEYITSVEPLLYPIVVKSPWRNDNEFNVNSSVILTYSDNNAITNKLLNDTYLYNYASFCYKSLDKTLYYIFNKNIRYHNDNLVYSYNKGHTPKQFEKLQLSPDLELRKRNDNFHICTFNSQSTENSVELHESLDWPKYYWESYD